MSTPGNPFSFENTCLKCGYKKFIITLESECPQCKYGNGSMLSTKQKGMIGTNFEILEKIQGGMGEVFICKFKNESLDTKIALKTFQKHLFFDKASQDSFIRDIINWHDLTGLSNVLPALGLEYYDGRPFVLMEAIEPDEKQRRTLTDHLTENQLEFNQVLYFALGISSGMRDIQTRKPGLIHGDLKPSNIFIKNDHHVLISDFGLSHSIHNRLGIALESTFAYQAPECRNKNKRMPSSDVYSFGVILYEMIMGKLPTNTLDTVDENKIHRDLSSNIPSNDNNIQEKYTRLVLDCLEEIPEKRPSFQHITKKLIDIAQDFDPLLSIDMLYNKYKLTMTLDPFQKYFQSTRIKTLLQIGKNELAFEELKKIPQSEFDGELWRLHGISLSLLNRDQQAIESFKKAIKQSKTDLQKYLCTIELGLSLKRLHRYNDAIMLYDKLYYEVPEDLKANVIINLATVHFACGNFQDEIKILESFLMKYPKYYQGWINLALAYQYNKEPDKAMKSFQRSLKLAPESSEIKLHYARFLMDDIGRIEDAAVMLNLACKQGLDIQEVYLRLIDCYIMLKKFKQAKEIAKMAMDIGITLPKELKKELQIG